MRTNSLAKRKAYEHHVRRRQSVRLTTLCVLFSWVDQNLGVLCKAKWSLLCERRLRGFLCRAQSSSSSSWVARTVSLPSCNFFVIEVVVLRRNLDRFWVDWSWHGGVREAYGMQWATHFGQDWRLVVSAEVFVCLAMYSHVALSIQMNLGYYRVLDRFHYVSDNIRYMSWNFGRILDAFQS